MDTNQQNNNYNTSSAFSTWNLEKNIMESTNEAQHHQIPMGSAGICWPNYNYNNNMATLFAPPSSSSSPSLTTVPTIIEVVEEEDQEGEEELGAMKEMMYKIAAMQPVDIDPASIRKPKRRNVRISDDPQSVAARHRRERISEKIRILQRLVPGGTKMDTASMLDEAIRYVKFLKRQIRLLQSINNNPQIPPPQQYYCTPNNYNSSTLLLAPSSTTDHWPFAPPNVLLPSSATAAAAVDLPPAGVGFDGPSSSSFNHHHHEVISE